MFKQAWHHKTIVIATSILLSVSAISEGKKAPKKSGVKMDPSQTLKIVYGSAPWNTDSTKIDTAYLYVKDGSTQKMVKIFLEETEPDSSTFQGYFSLGWSGQEEVYREVYVPPQNLRAGKANAEKFARMIMANKVPRRPIVFKKTPEGMQVLDVYDTRDQAEQAYQLYQKQKEAEQEKKVEESSLAKPVLSKSTLELAKEAARKAALAKMLAEAAAQESNRVRLEQLEKQRQAERLAAMKALKEEEIRKRKAEAASLSIQAIEAFKNGQYQLAEDLFRKSVKLDPENKSYYYFFGVTLFKNEKFNEAMVILNLSNPPEEEKINKDYYMGLTHYKLKELNPAIDQFKKVRGSGHPVLGPSGAFYQGLILFSMEKYKEAKEPFEWVIDNSQDPKLDDKAEKFLEKIASLLIFKQKQSETYILNFMGAASYDSNVLFSPDGQDSSQGSSTDKGGFRTLALMGFEYRPIYERTHEFSVKLNTLGMYSLNSEFSKADPYMGTLTLPYSLKGSWGKKGYKLTFHPGYEALIMDANDDGSPESLLNSIVLNTDLTLIMASDWIASYKLDARSDDSLSADSTGDSDADALKYALKTSQTFLLDKSKKRAFVANGGITMNDAVGKEKKYMRIDLGCTYARPFANWKDASWNVGVSTYKLYYNDADSTREDTNITLSGGISKPIKKDFNWGATATYANNQSNQEANAYSKYTVMGTLTYRWAK